MNAREYYDGLLSLIASSSLIANIDLQFREVDTDECFVRGVLTLINGFELHFAEYVVTTPQLFRPKYRYHLQQSDGAQVARWDNAPHHPELSNPPHHRHEADNSAYESPEMDPELLLATLGRLLNKM